MSSLMGESYCGSVQTVNDALLIFEACRLGLLNKAERRLIKKERQLVRSGAVFIWDEEQTGMRRWTDGRTWTDSRIHGNFLLYREIDGKRKSSSVTISKANGSSCPPLAASSDMDESGSPSSSPEAVTISTEQLLADTVPGSSAQSESLPSPPLAGGAFKNMTNLKKDGLIKLSFSVTVVTGNRFHLVHYYSPADLISGLLITPSKDPVFAGITISREYYPGTVNNLGTGELKVHNRRNPSPNPREIVLSRNGDMSQGPYVGSGVLAPGRDTKPQQQQKGQPEIQSPLFAPSSQIHVSRCLYFGTSPSLGMDTKLGSRAYQQNSIGTFALFPGSDFSNPYSLHGLNRNMDTGNSRSGSVCSFSSDGPDPLALWSSISPFSAAYPPPYFSSFSVQPAPYQEVAWEKHPNSEDKRQLKAIYAMLSF